MSEFITNREAAEARLQKLVERFRETPLSTTESYVLFELDDDKSAAKYDPTDELHRKIVADSLGHNKEGEL